MKKNLIIQKMKKNKPDPIYRTRLKESQQILLKRIYERCGRNGNWCPAKVLNGDRMYLNYERLKQALAKLARKKLIERRWDGGKHSPEGRLFVRLLDHRTVYYWPGKGKL